MGSGPTYLEFEVTTDLDAEDLTNYLVSETSFTNREIDVTISDEAIRIKLPHMTIDEAVQVQSVTKNKLSGRIKGESITVHEPVNIKDLDVTIHLIL